MSMITPLLKEQKRKLIIGELTKHHYRRDYRTHNLDHKSGTLSRCVAVFLFTLHVFSHSGAKVPALYPALSSGHHVIPSPPNPVKS